ncbi:histidine kinase [aff. Roholtiella sp. LEGE 12411]|nr:histidine kinase [aff. Roholtiella sp. LEGE 12411]
MGREKISRARAIVLPNPQSPMPNPPCPMPNPLCPMPQSLLHI